MKKQFKALVFLALMGFSALAMAGPIVDTVVVNDGFYGQHQTLTFTEGTLTGSPALVGAAAIFGSRFDIFFTLTGSNVIRDHLYSQGGGSATRSNDSIYFSASGMTDALLGTTCGANQVCVALTGQSQDVTQLIIQQIGANRWCGGGGTCNVTVQSEGANVPEPASVALFGFGLLGLVASRRKLRK